MTPTRGVAWTISFPPLRRAVIVLRRLAARDGHVYILEWVLKQPWADRVDWSEAANTAAGRGRLFVLQWLYANSTRQMVDWGSIHNHVCGDSDPVMAGR